MGASGVVEIGDNVFIGMNTIIERNVKIGANVVIGAGSVVTKDCDSNSVYAGIPAKKIMSIDEYFNKRCTKQKEEAKELAVKYYERFEKLPDQNVFREYFMLFENSNTVLQNSIFSYQLQLGNTKQQSIEYMNKHIPEFQGYEEFMRWCFDKNGK